MTMRSTYEEWPSLLVSKLTHFTLVPGSRLDDETVEHTESELKKTGAEVETKTDSTTTRFFFVRTTSSAQADSVRETLKRLGYMDFVEYRRLVENS